MYLRIWPPPYAYVCICVIVKEASRGFEPPLLDSKSRVLTVPPRGQVQAFGGII